MTQFAGPGGAATCLLGSQLAAAANWRKPRPKPAVARWLSRCNLALLRKMDLPQEDKAFLTESGQQASAAKVEAYIATHILSGVAGGR